MLPSRSGRSRRWGVSAAIIIVGFVGYAALAADPTAAPKDAKAKNEGKGKDRKAKQEASKAGSPGMLGGIPLPIGQEVKGLVLPDFDTQGRMRARFEAGTAKRIDAERVHFTGLKMMTFTLESAPDLNIDMPDATLNLNTRVITSTARTTVARTDFSISGDTMQFDTVGRTGTLVGNVKMVITDTSELTGKAGE